MNYLLPGREPQERLNLLISLTRINSEEIISALNERYVKGVDESIVCITINPSNFKRAAKKIEDVARIVELIKEIDYGNR